MKAKNKNKTVWICCNNGVAIPLDQYRWENFCEIPYTDDGISYHNMSVFL